MRPPLYEVFCFPVYSRTYSLTSQHNCTHPIVEETPVAGRPANVAMSVVLSSMLHTTPEFNAFEMIIESHKFDMNEPLIFHLTQNTEFQANWDLFIVDPAAIVLLLDNGTDINNANSMLLLKTFVHLCCVRTLETNLQAIHIRDEWTVFRGGDALSFLSISYLSLGSFLALRSYSYCDFYMRLMALLKTMCGIGLCNKPCVGPATVCAYNCRPLGKFCLYFTSKNYLSMFHF